MIEMDGQDLGIVDLGNTAIPTTFQLDEPLLPCTSRNISFRFCFPDGDGVDCLRSPTGGLNSYDVQVGYQFAPTDPPCETQTVKMQFDFIIHMGVETNDYKVDELFDIQNNVLKLKNEYKSTAIYLFDVSGRMINVNYSDKLDLTDLKIGIYYILIEDGNKEIRTTYIKTN